MANETGNDVVVQVKKNQKTLYNDCRRIAETMSPAQVYQEPTTKARNRIESRQVEVFTTPNITDAEKWSLVDAIVKVERNRLLFDTKTKCWQRSDETSFYVSTVVLSAQGFCEGIRNHWGIENRNQGCSVLNQYRSTKTSEVSRRAFHRQNQLEITSNALW